MSIRLLGTFAVVLLACATSATAAPLDSAALRQSLDRVLEGHVSARRTTVTLKVVDLQTGQALFDRGGDKLLTPASNLKLYTSACALDLFGPEHQFETKLMATGPIEETGTLRGDLILVGCGDAMLSHAELATMADQAVEKWGLHYVEGRVVVDNSRYAPRLKGPGWMWDDDPGYYNMSVTPLMVDFNVLTVRLAPQADGTVGASLVPKSQFPKLQRIVSAHATPSEYEVTRKPFEHDLLITGSGPLDEPVDSQLTMHDPGPWVAALFAQMLENRGVVISNRDISTPTNGKRSLSHPGPTLAETLKHFNHSSENAVGEVLLHEIAIARGNQQPNWSDGAQAITAWLVQTAGLQPSSFRLVDGSGLSRYNLISAASSIDLLRFMAKHPQAAVFSESLPNLKRLDRKRTPTAGVDPESLRAKTGSMAGVANISGYVTTLAGRRLAFSLLANGFIGEKEPLYILRGEVLRQLVQFQPRSAAGKASLGETAAGTNQ